MYVCFKEAGEKGGVKLVHNFNCYVHVLVLELGVGCSGVCIARYLRYFIIFKKRCLKGKRHKKIILSMPLLDKDRSSS